MTYQITWPKEKAVTEEQLLIWAKEAFANQQTNTWPKTAEEAIEILEDLGYVVIKRGD